MAFANNVIPGHRGGLINVVSWIFMVIMILASTAKIVNKWQRVKGLMLDDYLLIAAAVSSHYKTTFKEFARPNAFQILAVAQTIAINIQVSSGLGDTAPPKDGPHLTTYQRVSSWSHGYVLNYQPPRLPTLRSSFTSVPSSLQKQLPPVSSDFLLPYDGFA